jgi:Na+-driven multidrug efflux pump
MSPHPQSRDRQEFMSTPSLAEMFSRLLRAEEQGRAAKTVEIFGWLILFEGVVMLFAPHQVASLLHLQPLMDQAANYLRLVGVLASGVGMLYAVSGRLNAQGFVFASLLDRPLVPPLMAVLWYLGIVPGSLALAFSVQDFASFLWTLAAWRAERRAASRVG